MIWKMKTWLLLTWMSWKKNNASRGCGYSAVPLDVVGLTDGENLVDMMAAVGEVEAAPLVDAERAEDHVSDAAVWAKESFGFVEELVDGGESGGSFGGEIFATESLLRDGWRDERRSFPAAGHEAEVRDDILSYSLPERGENARRHTFCDAAADGGFGGGVGEAEVVDDLLDAPLFAGRGYWRRGAELGLGGVEAAD
jgi:hypothetical protein